jgi:hypothetical protein
LFLLRPRPILGEPGNCYLSKVAVPRQVCFQDALRRLDRVTGDAGDLGYCGAGLCGAPCGSLQIFDGEQVRAVADRGLAEPFVAMLRQGYRPDLNALRRQMFGSDRGVQLIADFRELLGSAPNDPVVRAGVEIARLGTVPFVPLHKDNAFLGRIVAARQEIRPFIEKQIGLLQNFAAPGLALEPEARETRSSAWRSGWAISR